ncbi:hypothetical protein [Pseudodesulfovibrio sediminis]|uniref:Uncharacterized protein n=1 Tax=Pseudodesulfovibrio sediminis TaxID=2810563 RepID=A0ABN6EQ14_9BACT|nr:hypothetical protein [Pseudodesulfovibrio sediminis]BCS87340.1 hypothetical protein PSDVSF_05820 [Pseudodesulfovibrio sediminis]
MIRRVDTQPVELCGFEYAQEEYEWFELVGPDGGVYAVCGLTFRDDQAWLYWRILGFSVGALKELRKFDVPLMKGFCMDRGATVMMVASDDKRDVHFTRMVGFMGFDVQMFGFQRLEG